MVNSGVPMKDIISSFQYCSRAKLQPPKFCHHWGNNVSRLSESNTMGEIPFRRLSTDPMVHVVQPRFDAPAAKKLSIGSKIRTKFIYCFFSNTYYGCVKLCVKACLSMPSTAAFGPLGRSFVHPPSFLENFRIGFYCLGNICEENFCGGPKVWSFLA